MCPSTRTKEATEDALQGWIRASADGRPEPAAHRSDRCPQAAPSGRPSGPVIAMPALFTRRSAVAGPSISEEYVLYLQGRLVEAEASLAAMNEKYEQTKARFNRNYARRGITPESDIVNYISAKTMNPELKFWYSKVEHFQREVAAYGSALTGLDAARRMVGSHRYRVPVDASRLTTSRRGLNRAS